MCGTRRGSGMLGELSEVCGLATQAAEVAACSFPGICLLADRPRWQKFKIASPAQQEFNAGGLSAWIVGCNKNMDAAGVRLSTAVCFIMRAGFKESTCDARASALCELNHQLTQSPMSLHCRAEFLPAGCRKDFCTVSRKKQNNFSEIDYSKKCLCQAARTSSIPAKRSLADAQDCLQAGLMSLRGAKGRSLLKEGGKAKARAAAGSFLGQKNRLRNFGDV